MPSPSDNVLVEMESNQATGAEKQIQELRSQLTQLKDVLKLQAHMQHQMIENMDASLKTFFEKCVATLLAWNSSSMGLRVLKEVFSFIDDFTLMILCARLVYALIATLVCTAVVFFLTPARIEGTTFPKDLLKLVKACMGMLIAWGWKDLIAALYTHISGEFWDEILVAVVVTLIVTLWELAPCYGSTMKGIHDGTNNSLLARYIVLPASLGLTVGYSWNEVATYIIGKIQAETASANLKFITQLVYFLLAASAIIYLTQTWAAKKQALAEEKVVGDGEAGGGASPTVVDAEHHAHDFEKVAGTIMVTSLSFVYAWAMSDTLNDFFFPLMIGCSSATKCSQGANAAFAVILTVAFTYKVAQLQGEQRRSEHAKTFKVLQINGMSLSVGWAWMNFAEVTVDSMVASMDVDPGWLLLVLLVASWVGLGLAFHFFLQNQRVLKRQRKEEAERHGLDYSL